LRKSLQSERKSKLFTNPAAACLSCGPRAFGVRVHVTRHACGPDVTAIARSTNTLSYAPEAVQYIAALPLPHKVSAFARIESLVGFDLRSFSSKLGVLDHGVVPLSQVVELDFRRPFFSAGNRQSSYPPR
jgi:hypothetical protein